MSANGSNGFLNIEDANLRVRSGNVYAKGITVGGITVGAAHGLQSVSDVSNTTSNTLQFTNATTSFKATSNIEIGGDVSYTSKPKISVESNVVAEYTGPHDRPLRKYPEVPLTANSDKGYVASASSSLTSTPAYLAFDGTTGTTWHTQFPYYTENGGVYDPGNPPGALGTYSGTLPSHELVSGYAGEYITLGLPNRIKMSKISINTRVDANLNLDQTQSAEIIVVVGSHDGSTWEFVDTHTVGKYPDDNTVPYTFNVNTSTYYEHVGLICTNTGPTDSIYNTAWSISKLAFYGHEEGSGSLDTTLKSVYNVPATTGTQLEVYYDGQDYSANTDFDQANEVLDKSGNNLHGSQTGDVGFDSTYKAFTFDGSGDSISRMITNSQGAYVHSWSTWVKLDTLSGQILWHLGQDGTGGGNDTSSIYIQSDGGLDWFWWSNDVRFNNQKLITGTWYHLAGSYNGGAPISSRKLWINGIEQVISSTSGNQLGTALSLEANTTLRLGTRYNGGGFLDGSIANFRLYSKALNADQVKELYDYQKDYFLGSKSQVTLYKGHLGVGVTEPSGQLELAGDERIQEYPPRALTGYSTHIEGHGVFDVNFANWYSGNTPWGMYKKNNTTGGQENIWYGPYEGNNGYSGGHVYSGTDFAASTTSGLFLDDVDGNRYYGAWTTIAMPYDIYLKQIHIYQGASSEGLNSRCVTEDGVILGSENGHDWYHVHTFTGLQYGGSAGSFSYSAAGERVVVNAKRPYKYYALVTTRTLHYDFTVIIGELRWFGTPGPTTLDKGSLTLGRSLDVPRISRYDVDTETPRPEKLVVDFDTTVNSSPTDISGKGNHGAFNGGAYYSAADKAFVFDGTDDLIKSTIEVTANFAHSVSVWIKVDTVGENTFFSLGNETTVGTDLTLKSSTVYTTGSGFTFTFYGGDMTIPFSYSTDRWYHIVATRDTGGTFPNTQKFYIDGVDYSASASWNNSTSTTLALPTTATLLIGKILWATSARFDGQISNFKLYNVALEPSEVQKLYRLGRTGRSMVISDTAVGIGKVPEAQLDVRGTANFAGYVGIGTTNPGKLLEISGASGLDNSSPVHFRITNTQNATNGDPFTDITKPSGLISFYTPDTSTAGPGDVAGIGFRPESTVGGDTALCFYTDSDNTNDPVAPLQERMCITHDGNVGIGTSDPTETLSISSPNTNGAALRIRNKLTAAIEETASYAYTNMRQKPNISGNDRALQFESYPYGAAGQNIMTWLAWNSTNNGWLTPITLTSSGNLTISGSYSPSDDRLKTNEAYIENATETLLKLKPQKYDKHSYSFLEVTPETYSNSIDGNVFIEPANIWVDANTFTYSTTDNVWYKRTLSDVTHEEAGLIAQDIWYDTPELRYIVSIPNDAQIPETKPEVSDDPTIDPDYENWGRKNATVNYTYLIPYLIKSNQELHTELQTVKARLDALENA
jgi:hypothetical protein